MLNKIAGWYRKLQFYNSASKWANFYAKTTVYLMENIITETNRKYKGQGYLPQKVPTYLK